jgi:hypothetical protein
VCDDGNLIGGDGCEPDCTPTPRTAATARSRATSSATTATTSTAARATSARTTARCSCRRRARRRPMYVVCDDGLDLANKNDKTNAHKAMGICNDMPTNSVQITNFQLQRDRQRVVAGGQGLRHLRVRRRHGPEHAGPAAVQPARGRHHADRQHRHVIKAPNGQGIVQPSQRSQGGNGSNNEPRHAGRRCRRRCPTRSAATTAAGGTPFQDCDGVNDCSDTLASPVAVIAERATRTTSCGSRSRPRSRSGTFGYTFDFVFCSSEWPSGSTPVQRPADRLAGRPDADDPNADPPIDAVHRQRHVHPRPERPEQGPAADDHGARPVLRGPGLHRATSRSWPAPGSRSTPAPTGSPRRAACSRARPHDRLLHRRHGRQHLATMAILDNFRWDCEGCVPSEVDDCGVTPPQ